MATTLATILVSVRDQINEPVPDFWSDAELLRYANRGIRDLWRQINQAYQDYHFALDIAVTQAAGASELSNVPANCGIIRGLEVLDFDTHPFHYRPKAYNHPEFIAARQMDALQQGASGVILYAATGLGAPVGAPTIRVAPTTSAEVTLRLTYQPTIGAELTTADNVPAPGEADQALIEWTTAYALGRQRNAGAPDPARLTNYQLEVTKILVGIAPRDESEPTVAEGMFEGWS